MSTITAARILRGQLNGSPGEENLLEFEKFPHVGLTKVFEVNNAIIGFFSRDIANGEILFCITVKSSCFLDSSEYQS